jgi:hypothetical protein
MKRTSMLELITIAAVALLSVVSLGQDPPAQEPQEEPKPPKLKLNEVTFGMSSFRGSTTLNQYASPIDGLALHSLRMLWPWTETSPFARLIVRGMPGQDNYAEGAVNFNRGNTKLLANRLEYGNFVLDWRPKSESIQKEAGVTVDHAFAPNIGGFVSYSSSKHSSHYPAPLVPDLTQTQTVSGGFGGDLLGGNLGLVLSDRRIYTETGVQPTSLQRQINANYVREFGDSLSIGGSANFARIEQAGLVGSDIRSYSLFGNWDIGPATDLQFQLAQQDLDLNTVQNAYVRKRLSTSARLIHRMDGWAMQLGYQRKESERVRTDQSFVDVPISDLFDFRLSRRMGATRFSLKGSWEGVSSDAVMNTDDPRSLYWGDRATIQAKVDMGADAFSAYGVYTYRMDRNEARNAEVGWHNVALGGGYVFSPDLSGYAEISFDEFRAAGASETNQTLDFYFPNGRTLALGVDWSKSPDLAASANLNYYESGDVRGSQLTLSLRRRMSADSDLELVVAPWRHDDRQFDLTSYYTTIFSARYTVRF